MPKCCRPLYRAAGTLLLALLLLAVGCKSSRAQVKTYPLTGTVKYRNGQVLEGGMVEFRATDPQQLCSVHADVKADGTFAATTICENSILNGAPEGTYTATVVLPPPPEQKQRPTIYSLPPTTTFKVEPGDRNHFDIVLPAAAPKGS
jgi:hypothetical protein